METLIVELGERSYPIYIGQDVSDAIVKEIEQRGGGRNGAVVVDRNFAGVRNVSLSPACIKLDVEITGETAKAMSRLGDIYDGLAANNIGRDGYLLAYGGGVTGDLAGFAAATYLRGIDYYQVPTTLLAMVDSSVGGKTGINIDAGKNLVGSFWQPRAVFINTDYLQTLPPREFSAGMAEVIKYGMLYDAGLFDLLENLDGELTWNHPELPGVIRRCCEIKAEVVRADEKEMAASGGRALLNLGHTFAHAIENVAGYGEYLHGEAVGVGLVMAARLSQELGHMDDADVARVRKLVTRYALPVALNKPLATDALMRAMLRDKKVRGGKLRFVAMEALGRAITVDGVDEALVRKLWAEFGAA